MRSRRACDRVLAGLRWSSEEPDEATPSSGALCYRRQQLGVRVVRQLFRRICQPFAQAETPGSFAFGLRLVGIDGTPLSVAESPPNRRCFRRQPLQTTSTARPFPQLLAVLLVELGTHAIFDAIPALPSAGESTLARGLLRSIQAGMLLMQDRGFFSVAFIQKVVQRGAQVLGRLASNRLLAPGQRLRDGSVLLTLSPKHYSALLLGHYALRVLMARAATQAQADVDRISFTHAIVLFTDAILLAPALDAAKQASLSPERDADLARHDWLSPARRLRFNSRVIKRSRNRFQIKRPEHGLLRAKDIACLQEHSSPCFAHLVVLLI